MRTDRATWPPQCLLTPNSAVGLQTNPVPLWASTSPSVQLEDGEPGSPAQAHSLILHVLEGVRERQAPGFGQQQ